MLPIRVWDRGQGGIFSGVSVKALKVLTPHPPTYGWSHYKLAKALGPSVVVYIPY